MNNRQYDTEGRSERNSAKKEYNERHPRRNILTEKEKRRRRMRLSLSPNPSGRMAGIQQFL